MKVLVTGVHGQVGYDCMKELRKRNHNAIGTSREDMDIIDYASVEQVLNEVKPEAVIHCAGWTAVDAAEDADNIEKVRLANVVGTENIAKVCKSLGCKLMYLSTDYVFDGQGTRPWHSDCKTFTPLNVYGKTKLAGEFAVTSTLDNYFIVRIAWVFGINGNNFVKTMLHLGKTYNKIRVVNDQIGTPTYSYDLARLLVDMIETDKYGYYHASNEGGYISWYEFTKEIFHQAVELGHTEYAEDRVSVIPVTTEDYGLSKAKRPFNSRLDKHKLIESGFTPLPDWKNAVERYLKEIEF